MDYYESILKVVDLIEQNLDENIPLSDIIQSSGFSKYHFSRIFKALSGDTVAEYRRKRKLTAAASELVATNASILEIAVKYGYTSHEAFTRSFNDYNSRLYFYVPVE